MNFKHFTITIKGDRLTARGLDWESDEHQFSLDSAFEGFFQDVKESFKRSKRIICPRHLSGFGKALYRSLFPGTIGSTFKHLFQSLKDDEYLRLFLHLKSDESSLYPWEYLMFPESEIYLCRHPKLGIARWIPPKHPYYSPSPVSPPFRMLIIVSDPPGTEKFDWKKGLKSVKQAVSSFPTKFEEPDILENPSRERIEHEIINKGYHLIHYLGHSKFSGDRGCLLLKMDNGIAGLIDEDVVADIFLGSSTVKLICLNACESGTHVSYQAFSGVAKKLVQKGIPSVVAMQNPILASDARDFSEAFYQAFGDGLPVDLAVNRGRKAIHMETQEGHLRCDFGTPVVFLRTREDKLFESPLEEKQIELPETIKTQLIEKADYANLLLTSNMIIDKFDEHKQEVLIMMLANILYESQQLIKILNYYEPIVDTLKSIIKLPYDKAIELCAQFQEGSERVKQLQNEFDLQNVAVQETDLLVVDDSEAWQDIVVETFDSIYSCETVSTYEEAIKKIDIHNYKVVCLSDPFYSPEKHKLLERLKKGFPETPVIIFTNDPLNEKYISNILGRYRNVKEIIFKGQQPDGSGFVSSILNRLPKLLPIQNSIKDN